MTKKGKIPAKRPSGKRGSAPRTRAAAVPASSRKSTLVPADRHPARDIPEAERIDYLTVVASMAFADHDASDDELNQVRRLCRHMELSPDGADKVLAAARDPDGTAVDAILERLRPSDLRFALLVDAIDIAFTDREIVPSEAAEIDALAKRLDIPAAQVALLRKYVQAKLNAPPDDPEATEKAAAALVGAGIPAAGLAVATVIGAPLVAGAGVAAALGVGSYVSVRWLLRRARRKRTPPPA